MAVTKTLREKQERRERLAEKFVEAIIRTSDTATSRNKENVVTAAFEYAEILSRRLDDKETAELQEWEDAQKAKGVASSYSGDQIHNLPVGDQNGKEDTEAAFPPYGSGRF